MTDPSMTERERLVAIIDSREVMTKVPDDWALHVDPGLAADAILEAGFGDVTALRAEVARLNERADRAEERIAAAPHDSECLTSNDPETSGVQFCNCWKFDGQPAVAPEPRDRRCAWEGCPGRTTDMHEIESGEELHDECKAALLADFEPPYLDPLPYYVEEVGYPFEADGGRYSVLEWVNLPDESTVANLATLSPRLTDTKGRPYSQRREDYKGGR